MSLRENAVLAVIVNRGVRSLSYSDRKALGIESRADARDFVLGVIADSIPQYAAAHPNLALPTFGAIGDGTIIQAILDFLRELIEQGKIQPFLQWLFEQLPILIKAIVDIFMARAIAKVVASSAALPLPWPKPAVRVRKQRKPRKKTHA